MIHNFIRTISVIIPLTKAIDDTDITTMFNTDVLEQKILSYKSIRYRVKGKNHSLVMKNILDLYIRYMMISNIIQNFNIYTRYKKYYNSNI